MHSMLPRGPLSRLERSSTRIGVSSIAPSQDHASHDPDGQRAGDCEAICREGAYSRSLAMMSASIRSISGDSVFRARPPGAARVYPVKLSPGQFDPFGTDPSPSRPAWSREWSSLMRHWFKHNGDAPCGRRSRVGDTREDDRRTSRPVDRQAMLASPRGGTCASRFGPAMLPGIGRLGAGSCTIRSQRRHDFLMRAIWTTFI